MRTTVDLEPDVVAAVEALRRREHVSIRAAVDRLIREGLANGAREAPSFGARAQVGERLSACA
jgi:hypothetical protein